MKATLVVITLLLCPIGQSLFGGGLRLTLRMDRSSYVETQAIWLDVVVKNQSEQTLSIPEMALSESDFGVSYIVTDQNGRSLNATASSTIEDWGARKEIPIAPGDSVEQWHQINGLYTNSQFDTTHAPLLLHSLQYLGSGRYSVSAKVFTGRDTLVSNVVIISITSPTGIDSVVIEKLRAFEKSIWNGTERRQVEGYEELLSVYPSSIITPLLYNRLIPKYYYSSSKDAAQRLRELALQFAESMPHDAGTISALRYATAQMSQDEKRQTLSRLYDSLPSSIVGKFCGEELKKIQK